MLHYGQKNRPVLCFTAWSPLSKDVLDRTLWTLGLTVLFILAHVVRHWVIIGTWKLLLCANFFRSYFWIAARAESMLTWFLASVNFPSPVD